MAAREAFAANFVDITVRSGIDFQHQSSRTSKKYLLEAMGSGVAVFDYDNDGRSGYFLRKTGRIWTTQRREDRSLESPG